MYKENKLIAPPLGILVFKFERPISNNKENKMFAPPLGRPWQLKRKIL